MDGPRRRKAVKQNLVFLAALLGIVLLAALVV
jgi:hypothetical protein